MNDQVDKILVVDDDARLRGLLQRRQSITAMTMRN